MIQENDESFSRLHLLIGEDDCRRLANARLFLCGTGGVGSYAAEAVARAGVGHITIMDPDVVRPSNINRQLCALHSTLGRYKAEVVGERLLDISPNLQLQVLVKRLEATECGEIISSGNYDCVIDAIDERPPKLALIAACREQGIPIVSSMGAANKINPEIVRVDDISKSFGCPLAKITRKNLRKMGVEKGVRVVYSPEQPSDGTGKAGEPEADGEKRPLGTISYMPGIFGLMCAAEAIRLLREQ